MNTQTQVAQAVTVSLQELENGEYNPRSLLVE